MTYCELTQESALAGSVPTAIHKVACRAIVLRRGVRTQVVTKGGHDLHGHCKYGY